MGRLRRTPGNSLPLVGSRKINYVERCAIDKTLMQTALRTALAPASPALENRLAA